MLKLVEWMSVTLKRVVMTVIKPRALEGITSLHSGSQVSVLWHDTDTKKVSEELDTNYCEVLILYHVYSNYLAFIRNDMDFPWWSSG